MPKERAPVADLRLFKLYKEESAALAGLGMEPPTFADWLREYQGQLEEPPIKDKKRIKKMRPEP